MTDYSLTPFGQINIDALDEFYGSNVEINGKVVRIDLNFDQVCIEKDAMNAIKFFMENLEKFDMQNKIYIEQDFENEEGEVKEYINFHLHELASEELERIGVDFSKEDKEQQFLAKLYLKRVGIYPDKKYGALNFAVFDYTASEDFIDQLIVIETDDKGNIKQLCLES